MIIRAFNSETDQLEKSYLSDQVAVGATSLTVKNNDRFAANDRIMIGEMGREKTEIVTVSGVSGGTVITTGATVFPHEADTPVYKLRFDQVKFYRSTTGSSGTYSLLATVAMDVDNELLETQYDDTTGTSAYYYKISYHHSVSTLESAQSDAFSGGGYSRNTVGFVIDEILREVKDETELETSRTEILGWFNEVNDDLITRSSKPYDFLRTRTTLSTVASTETVDFPTDMWKFDRMDHLYQPDSSTDLDYPVRVVSLEEFRVKSQDNDLEEDDELQLIALDTAVDKFRLYPVPDTSRSGVLYLYYWKKFTQIDSEGDTFETPNQRIYKLYAKAMFYRKKAVADGSQLPLSDRYMADYNSEVAKMTRANRKDAGSPRSFRFLPQSFKGNRRF